MTKKLNGLVIAPLGGSPATAAMATGAQEGVQAVQTIVRSGEEDSSSGKKQTSMTYQL
jgi:hypothetical protein